jgi:outer membrane lipoprotein SlyB
MKKAVYLVLGLFMVSFNMGCQSSSNRAVEGGVIGGLVGATIGGIVGHQSGHGGEGAAIGAAAGVLGGAVVGSNVQKQPGQAAQPAQAPVVQQAYNPNQIAIQQIVELSREGVHEAVIIDKIKMSNSKYTLTTDDVNNLKQQGVSQNVINVMLGL